MMSIKRMTLSLAVVISTMAVTAFATPIPPVPEPNPGVIATVFGALVGCSILWKNRKRK